MSPAQNIAAAALAGVVIIGGAVYMEGGKLGLPFGQGNRVKEVRDNGMKC